MGPSRTQLLGADPDVVALRNLIAETNALPSQRIESSEDYYSLYNPLWYRTKTQQQYHRDQQRAHFLERAKEAGLHRSDNPSVASVALKHNEDAIRKLRSAREVYGQDWPIYNVFRFIDSPRAALFATGQMLANKVDPVAHPYPNAPQDYAKSMNNFLFFLDEPFGKNVNHMRDMQDMRDEMASVPWQRLDQSEENDYLRADYAKKASPKIGSQMLRESGINKDIGETATSLLGGFIDFGTDLFMSPSNSIGGLLLDVGLGTAHETLPLGAEAIRRLRPTTDIPY